MTWTLSCGDVMPGCTAVLVGDTRDAVLSAVGAHAGSDLGAADLDAATPAAVEAALRQGA
ncbi:MAG: DUF1059 domain-containing protein [Pseudorhodobacter sp.]|nr:DUF1059 domain-containing protein [Frankiaceae bacterium]